MTTPKNTGPLAGLKVIEMGTLIAGPFCGRLLAEFGAEVIKIEAPADDKGEGGDPLRKWRKLHDDGDEKTSLWWYAQARNKKSMTINLREAEGQEYFGGEFSLRHTGKMGLGLRNFIGVESETDHGAAVWLWANRAV
jgi:crotonobetainyl-CoA:carnitine CoA-transferase CaiB-like acyl-CoA transferase